MAIHLAELTTRAHTPDSWDAGLHAESEQGPIDVGLSLEPEALALVVEAPGVGRLKVAFQLEDAGRTRLLFGARLLGDGRELPVAGDETRASSLEGQVLELQAELERLTAEADGAREQAAALAGHQEAVQGQLALAEERWQAEQQGLLAQLGAERDQRLMALGDRERARAELERLREELDAGSATLMGQVADARAGREAAEAQRSRLSEELAEASGRVQGLHQELEAALAGKAEAEQSLLAANVELHHSSESLAGVQAHSTAQEQELRAGLERERVRLEQAEAGREVAAGRVKSLECENEALLATRRELEGKLKTLETSESNLRRKLDALGSAQRGAGAAQSENQRLLGETRAEAQRLEAAAAAEQRATAEAREVARLLKAQLDQVVQERDEARNLARTLHQKAGGLPALEGELAQLRAATNAERQRLGLQIESLGRQLEQERTARARAIAELDAQRRATRVNPAPADGRTLGDLPEDTRPFRVPQGLLEAAQLTNPGVKAPTGKKKK